MDVYSTSFCLPRLPPRDFSPTAPSSPTDQRFPGNHPPSNGHSRPTSMLSESSFNNVPPSPSASTSNFPANGKGSGEGDASTAPRSRKTSAITDGRGSSLGAHERARSGQSNSAVNAGFTARTVSDTHEALQRLSADIMKQYHCNITVNTIGPNSEDPTASPVASTSERPASITLNRQSEQNTASIQAVSGLSSTTLHWPVGVSFHFQLSGAYQQVMAARGAILREAPFRRKSIVKVPRSEVLDAQESVKAGMRHKLDEIASLTRAHLAIVGQISGSIGFGLETERNVEIVITGAYESVEQARIRLLVLLDELSGLHSEVCEIDYKLHNIIAGRKRCVIQTIQEETATNIYFPTPLSGVIGIRNPQLLAKQNLIFITGEFFGVQRARDMLFQVSLHKSKCIISRDTAILPRKLDWMLSEKLEEIKQSMNDNGTFINFPIVGSQASLISVYGDHRVNIERTIRTVMQLACCFYVASVWLLPASFEVFTPPQNISPSQVSGVLTQISTATGAEVVFKSNCFEVHGMELEVRSAVQMVLNLDLVKDYHHEIRFQIELANEHREFISGKKNGKLNKVMKTADVKIKFETFNDYNFLIDIAGGQSGSLEGLGLLQEELPAEISFHLPESYHKRIIGVGGKNIQRIMKQYGVYVKFSNAEEFAAMGGYHDNDDNVVCRTPAKNHANLDELKLAIMELVNPRDKDFVVETVSIPRRYHRQLVGEKSIFLHDIENKTNCTFRFPNKESASDIVTIFGPESQIHIAAQMLLVHIPFEAEFRIPHSAEMVQLVSDESYLALVDKIKHDFSITIMSWVDHTGGNDDTVLKFCLNRSTVDFLGPTRDLVENFLVSAKITLYPGSIRPRNENLADPFMHFNSALLSNNVQRTPADSKPAEYTFSPPEDSQDVDMRAQVQADRLAADPKLHPGFPERHFEPVYDHRPPPNRPRSPDLRSSRHDREDSYAPSRHSPREYRRDPPLPPPAPQAYMSPPMRFDGYSSQQHYRDDYRDDRYSHPNDSYGYHSQGYHHPPPPPPHSRQPVYGRERPY